VAQELHDNIEALLQDRDPRADLAGKLNEELEKEETAHQLEPDAAPPSHTTTMQTNRKIQRYLRRKMRIVMNTIPSVQLDRLLSPRSSAHQLTVSLGQLQMKVSVTMQHRLIRIQVTLPKKRSRTS
jgi:hypothetical protein